MLELFKDTPIASNTFTFTTSDDTVATVENNVIKLLKPGDVSIIAINEDTRETYTLNIKVSKPLVNPLTSRNTIYVLLGVFVIASGLSIYKLKKEH